MRLITHFKEWQAARKELRTERLTAKASDLTDDKQYDLLLLYRRGFIRVKGSGQSIIRIYGEVENLIRKKLNIVVKPGTYFVSSGNHQSMATTSEYTFTLYPSETNSFGIDAVCINASRPIPREDDRFFGVSRVSENVARFLDASKAEDPMVVQAGVWTLTDNYSRHSIINHLVQKDYLGNTSHPITHEHCDRAREILEELGISHRLWYSTIEYEKKTVKYGNAIYTGEFRYGEFHGSGKITMSDSSSYDGEWKQGMMHGNGTQIDKDGAKYVGKFENGLAAGGWQYNPDGSKSGWVVDTNLMLREAANKALGEEKAKKLIKEIHYKHSLTSK